MKTIKISLVIALMATGPAAIGLPAFLTSFKACYKVDKASTLGKANCVTCHATKGYKLNPYGQDLKKAMHDAKSKVLTPAILAAIEKLDSDKDGALNIDEIHAGTLPGDPKSIPTKK